MINYLNHSHTYWPISRAKWTWVAAQNKTVTFLNVFSAHIRNSFVDFKDEVLKSEVRRKYNNTTQIMRNKSVVFLIACLQCPWISALNKICRSMALVCHFDEFKLCQISQSTQSHFWGAQQKPMIQSGKSQGVNLSFRVWDQLIKLAKISKYRPPHFLY